MRHIFFDHILFFIYRVYNKKKMKQKTAFFFGYFSTFLLFFFSFVIVFSSKDKIEHKQKHTCAFNELIVKIEEKKLHLLHTINPNFFFSRLD
jgi:arginine exporter protein ArgO